jgi:hypothetical protein
MGFAPSQLPIRFLWRGNTGLNSQLWPVNGNGGVLWTPNLSVQVNSSHMLENHLQHVNACFYFGVGQVRLDSRSARSRKPRLRYPHLHPDPRPQYWNWGVRASRSQVTIVFRKQDQLQQVEGLNHFKIFKAMHDFTTRPAGVLSQ